MSAFERINRFTARRLMLAAILVALAGAGLWGVRSLLRKGAPAAAGARKSGMDMAGMQMGNGTVELTAEQVRTFGVTFGTVEERVLTQAVRTVGTVTFDETRLAEVTQKVGGYIERLHVDFTGKPVRRGQPLADIYSPELVAAQQELLLAARLDQDLSGNSVPGVPARSANLLSAARQRLRLWDVSDAQIDRILRSGTVERTITLFSPVSGVVVEKQILAGQAVQPGQKLYTIADLSTVWIEAELREADAGSLREGDIASIDFAAFPGRPLRGRVEYVYPTLQQQARTLKARLSIPNSDGRLKPGMYATIRFEAAGRRALTVPVSAILQTGERKIVFVDLGSGKVMPQEVEIGRTAGEYAEVLFGLEPGQRVVTSAQYLLDSESNLAEVMRSMAGMTNESGMQMNMSAPNEADSMQGADMRGMRMPRNER